MFKRRFNKNAQSTLEYAILIGVIVAALIAMQIYLKRGYQGKLRGSADDIGEQFSPLETEYDYTLKTSSKSTEDAKAGVTTTEIEYQTQSRSGTEKVSDMDQERWWK